jgi:hypothetical protein
MKEHYKLYVMFTYSQDGRSREMAIIEQTLSSMEWWLILCALDKSPDVVEMWCRDENDQKVTPANNLEKLK